MTNSDPSTLELIEKAVGGVLKKKIILRPENTARDVPEWDSLNNVKILIHLEMLIGKKVNTTQYFECKTMGELANYIDQLRGRRH